MRRFIIFIQISVLFAALIVGCQHTNAPQSTKWRYDGSYQYIAEDGSGADYPDWNVDKTIKTKFGDIEIPSEWKQEQSPSHQISLLTADGNPILEIRIQSFILSAPYYNVPPNHFDRISWESLGDRDGYRMFALTGECDLPAASGDCTITIKKYIYFISNSTGTYNGVQFQYGYCLSFNKATILNDEIIYLVSNKTIDEIIDHFKPYDFK